jgi:glycine/D-amino acid oxidase-like deaminating enzyme
VGHPFVSHEAVSREFDVAVVGGGIVGAACAAALAGGDCRVVVLEQGPIGGGATAAGMGHIVVMDDSPAQLALTSYSRRLWHALVPQLPASAECEQCGTLWVAADEEEMAAVERKQAVLATAGVTTRVLSATELAYEEPNLRRGLAGGLLVPDDLVVYPPVVAHCLLDRALAAGAELCSRSRVCAMREDGSLLLHDGATLRAGVVINATGSWAPTLTPGLPIRPRKGHLVITDRYPGFVRHQLIELGYLKSAHAADRESVAFNIQPRKTGQMLIGSSRQFDVENTDTEMRMVRKMIGRAATYLPGVINLVAIRMWAGHRAATPDKLPLIGPSAANNRMWLATGHEGLGITTSLGTAQLIAAAWRGRPTEIDAAPYLPTRLASKGATPSGASHDSH